MGPPDHEVLRLLRRRPAADPVQAGGGVAAAWAARGAGERVSRARSVLFCDRERRRGRGSGPLPHGRRVLPGPCPGRWSGPCGCRCSGARPGNGRPSGLHGAAFVCYEPGSPLTYGAPRRTPGLTHGTRGTGHDQGHLGGLPRLGGGRPRAVGDPKERCDFTLETAHTGPLARPGGGPPPGARRSPAPGSATCRGRRAAAVQGRDVAAPHRGPVARSAPPPAGLLEDVTGRGPLGDRRRRPARLAGGAGQSRRSGWRGSGCRSAAADVRRIKRSQISVGAGRSRGNHEA